MWKNYKVTQSSNLILRWRSSPSGNRCHRSVSTEYFYASLLCCIDFNLNLGTRDGKLVLGLEAADDGCSTLLTTKNTADTSNPVPGPSIVPCCQKPWKLWFYWWALVSQVSPWWALYNNKLVSLTPTLGRWFVAVMKNWENTVFLFDFCRSFVRLGSR